MDRDKYLRLFVDEARENVRELGQELLVCERLAKVDDTESDEKRRNSFDAVFRAAHSIKGMAASMGFENTTTLAHVLEDLAEVGRNGGRLEPTDFDLLLEAGDAIETAIDRIAEGGTEGEATDLVHRVKARLERSASGRVAIPKQPIEPSVPSQAKSSNEAALVVTMDVDAPLPAVRAFMLHRTLSGIDGFEHSEPGPDLIKSGAFLPGPIRFFFTASVDREAAEKAAREAQGVASATFDVEPPADDAEDPVAASGREERKENVEAERTVRVRTAMLDELIDSVGELLLTRSKLRVLAERYEEPEMHDLVDEIERLTRDLHDRVVSARMTPLSYITDRFPRVVRDLARQLDKSVDFEIEGVDIELDRAILDELSAPLLHILRNSMDHAHEGDGAREQAGKDRAMKLRLVAQRDRDRVLLVIEDDGGGIDAQAVGRRAEERGLVTEAERLAMSERELLELICAPGLSTRQEVTQTSGRGVGMDVVKATLERMGGALLIESVEGRFTRMTLDLPLTVAIIQVLVVEAGDQHPRDAFAVPVGRVDQALDLVSLPVRAARGRFHVEVRGDLIPLYDLSKELGFTDAARHDTGTAIVLGRQDAFTAFRVEGVVGQEEVVVKPLGPPLSDFPYLTGAALLADGRTAFILDPTQLVRAGSNTAGDDLPAISSVA